MENEEEIEFDLVKFLSSDNDSENDEEIRHFEKLPVNIVNGLINKIAKQQIKGKMSYVSASETVKLMNDMPNAAVEIQFNKKTVKNLADKAFEHRILILCEKCDELVEEKSTCKKCKCVMLKNSKKDNFLVYIPIEQQIRQLLNKYFDTIVAYVNREQGIGIISDTDDGQIIKNIRMKHPHVMLLSLTLNIDGANIFKSSKKSLWPVQAYFNGLPPSLRFLFDNLIITTFYYGEKKPNTKLLLYPLAKEMDYLNKEMISVYKNQEFYNFLPVITACACDLPARAELQNFKNVTGFYACPYCKQKGTSVKNSSKGSTVRYLKTTNLDLRSHKETLEIAKRVEASGTPIHGIKGQSVMAVFDHVNVIDSFAIDYMHGIALGIFKDLLMIWLGIKRIPEHSNLIYKIKSVENRKIFNKRILNLKPHLTFNRKPRSIFEVLNFKASELLYCMFYYVRYALNGLLPTRVIKHFEKLSSGIYTLCQKNIKFSEVREACTMLNDFANEYEEIYGPGAVTMNLHLLKHYFDVISNCGPLWSYSLFGFENSIGQLKKYVVGKTDVLSQISYKYLIDKNSSTEQRVLTNPCDVMYQPKIMDIEPQYKNVLILNGIIGSNEVNSIQIWRRMSLKNHIYTSIKATETKSIDYFVELKNGKMGKIWFFVQKQSVPHFLLHIYENNFRNHHWIEVKDKNYFEMYPCTYIEEKLLYFKVGSIEYVTREPNTYGKCCY